MRGQLAWELKKLGAETLVILDGIIDERSDLQPLIADLSGKVSFDFAQVRRINSEGVRRWVNFLRDLRATEVAFLRCSVAIVTQLNMISGFQGNATVRSFYAPYVCAATGKEELRLLTREDVPDPRNPPSYVSEDGVMELDDIPQRYFAFLLNR